MKLDILENSINLIEIVFIQQLFSDLKKVYYITNLV